MNGCAPGLALIERLKATRKWPIIVGYVVLSYTVQNVGFVGFVWCHVCFAALKINETVGKKMKKPQR